MIDETSILINVLCYFNLLLIPIYCFKRVKKNSYLSLMNPCFYLVVFSYLYLTFSSIFLELYVQSFKIVASWIDLKLMEPTKLIGNWFTFVFFIFYALSRDSKLIVLPFRPRKLTYKIAFILTFVISIILIVIAVLYIPSLIALSSRIAAYELSQNFIQQFKMKQLVTALLACLAILVWRTKNFKWFLLLLIPISIDLAAKGRSLTFSCVTFAYLNYIIISRKSILFKIMIVMGILVGTAILRLPEDVKDYSLYFGSIFGDLFLSWITTLMVYKHFLGYGDMFSYIGNSFLSLLPFDSLLELGQDKLNYINVLTEFYQQSFRLRFGLAGNIVSESLFYGGTVFAFFSPIIMGGILYCFNRFTIYKTFPGFIFFCLVVSNLRGIVRDSFYDAFLQSVTLMFSALIWILVLEYKRDVIVKQKKTSLLG